ncbi:hypothetical protein [Parasphingorhabdus pacifica]
METNGKRIVSCRDVTGQRRDMSISVDRGNIVVTAPPGDAAVLGPSEADLLRAAVRAAATTSADEADPN